jgi:isoleucyl-tRNA synthetase
MNLPKMEEEILKFWEENKIFEKSVEKNPADKSFVFYEGPPTANGVPGLHHVLARAFKDIIPRYKTMKGYRVERKAGWDTHGLPVEIQVEKELGIHQKSEIENIVPGNPRESIIEFNQKCKESVWKFKDLWEKMTRRMGYWVDLEHPYITYENKYIESVWWVIAQIAKLKTQKGEPVLYQGHKVIPYCYRCGTALSSHEVAQGYQKVKDNSVFVKFKVKSEDLEWKNTSLLAWTTTPWTLPGNVALAINPNLKYVCVPDPDEKENWIVLEYEGFLKLLERKFFPENYKQLEKNQIDIFNGQEILNIEYEPLYETNNTGKKAYFVISGDFITTQEGTGIVHIAPAFGEDDSNVGRVNNLPTLLTVDTEGKISVDVPGRGIPVKKKNDKNKYEVDDLIVEDLKKRGLLFKEELYEHDYPFCWRCDTPLIYYAKPSWFVRMSAYREIMEKNNQEINWIPEYIKEGRFGEWLRDAKDWAISRDRYWGTPLPIWKCQECGKVKIIESIDEMKEQLGNPNKLFLIRHGEAENNINKIICAYPEKKPNPLTKKGVEQIKKVANFLEEEKIDIIFSSPLQRTMETSRIISQKIGVKIIIDERLREVDLGELEGKTWDEYIEIYPNALNPDKTDKRGVEGLDNMKDRANSFIAEINNQYRGKNILIVSHGNILRVMRGVLLNSSKEDIMRDKMPEKGTVNIFYSKPFDLHKPFIDEITFKCQCGEEMRRVSEVMDVWFDSGSMPTAQWHYPNGATEEDKKKIESGKAYPADFISEAIDQTRGWFYTLHAISTLLNQGKKVPTGYAYKNVICLGHILDAKGKKMSKSKGNIVEPMEIMDKYGADMLRWMLYTINQPGMAKRFDIKKMNEIMNRVFRMMWNSYSFFVLYANIDKFDSSKNYKLKTTNLLDKWIVSELQMLIREVDEKLNKYDVYGTAGNLEKFIDNLSNWYIRRSRKRFWKSENDGDKKEAYQTLYYVLVELAKLMAPFTPFISEEIYRNLIAPHPSPLPEGEGELISVHLADFPKADEKLIDEKLNKEMQNVRNIISEGLQLRAKAGIKVRQPIASLKIKNQKSKVKNEFIEIIKDEVNVKNIIFDDSLLEAIVLDTEITNDLKLEGQAREIVRYIQEMRKEAGYEIDNRIKIGYNGLSAVFERFGDIIRKETLAEDIKSQGQKSEGLKEFDLEKEFKLDGETLKLQVKKIK